MLIFGKNSRLCCSSSVVDLLDGTSLRWVWIWSLIPSHKFIRFFLDFSVWFSQIINPSTHAPIVNGLRSRSINSTITCHCFTPTKENSRLNVNSAGNQPGTLQFIYTKNTMKRISADPLQPHCMPLHWSCVIEKVTTGFFWCKNRARWVSGCPAVEWKSANDWIELLNERRWKKPGWKFGSLAYWKWNSLPDWIRIVYEWSTLQNHSTKTTAKLKPFQITKGKRALFLYSSRKRPIIERFFSYGAVWVTYEQVVQASAQNQLRGHEPLKWFKYIVENGTVHPMSIFS